MIKYIRNNNNIIKNKFLKTKIDSSMIINLFRVYKHLKKKLLSVIE